MVCIYPFETQLTYNLNGDVGFGQVNFDEDVHFVQYSLFRIGQDQDMMSRKLGAAKNEIAEIKPGFPVNKANRDDPLFVAIRAVQKAIGGTQDGKVTRIQPGLENPGNYTDKFGTHLRLMAVFNSVLMDTKDWPLIFKDVKCPLLVGQRVRQLLNIKEDDIL
jgi:hypothetical protein